MGFEESENPNKQQSKKLENYGRKGFAKENDEKLIKKYQKTKARRQRAIGCNFNGVRDGGRTIAKLLKHSLYLSRNTLSLQMNSIHARMAIYRNPRGGKNLAKHVLKALILEGQMSITNELVTNAWQPNRHPFQPNGAKKTLRVYGHSNI